MKLLLLAFGLALFSIPAFAADIVLAPGHSTDWAAPHGALISVSDGSVVKTLDLGSRLKITARKIGNATVRIGKEPLSVHVVSTETAELWGRLAEALDGKRGLNLVIRPARSGNEIAVKGRLLRWQDWQALADAAGETDAHYSFEAEVSPELQAKAREVLGARLRADHLPMLAFAFAPMAHVTVPKEESASEHTKSANSEGSDLQDHVTRALAAYGFAVEASTEALGLEPMIRVRLLVAEFQKNFARQLGLKWPTMQAMLWPQLSFPLAGNLTVDVNAFEQSGAGKVLASPTLICRSGKEASFTAGGEIPIKTSSFAQQDVIWKQYGVVLNVKPKADYSGRMSIQISAEISKPDPQNKVDGVPGMHTNRIETFFDLAKSKTVILSGLIKKNENESSDGLAWLSAIPVIGPLFSSKEFQHDETELAIFVTPEVVSADSEDL